MATAADIAGVVVPVDAGEDSLSFLPAFQGGKTDVAKRAGIVNHSISGRFAIRRGDWKLEFCPGSGGWTAPNDKAALAQGLPEIQLYNLADDPAESANVYDQHPEIVSELTKLLLDYTHSGASVAGKKSANDTEPWHHLKAIK